MLSDLSKLARKRRLLAHIERSRLGPQFHSQVIDLFSGS